MNGSGRYLDENEGATRCVSRVAVLRVAWAWGAGVMVWAPHPLSLCKLAKCNLLRSYRFRARVHHSSHKEQQNGTDTQKAPSIYLKKKIRVNSRSKRRSFEQRKQCTR